MHSNYSYKGCAVHWKRKSNTSVCSYYQLLFEQQEALQVRTEIPCVALCRKGLGAAFEQQKA